MKTKNMVKSVYIRERMVFLAKTRRTEENPVRQEGGGVF